jgi:hypothetical protein
MTAATTVRHEVEVDTKLAALYGQLARLDGRGENILNGIHYAAKDRKDYHYSKFGNWTMKHAEAIAKVQEMLASGEMTSWDATSAQRSLASLVEYEAEVASIQAEIAPLQAEYRANPWPRFFIVQNNGGHIHSSMSCSTCNNGRFSATRFGWLPELSGLTEADAVASQGAILCTVCYPSAPVEWTNGVSKEEQAKQALLCPGTGTTNYEGRRNPKNDRLYGYQECKDCGKEISLLANGTLRSHKKPVKKGGK